MVLLVNVDLTNPPTSLTCFRTLTLFAKLYLKYDVLLETDAEKDTHFHFLRDMGCMDFVDDIVILGEETGIRIDHQLRFAPTYIVDRIDVHNINLILSYLGLDLSMLTKKPDETCWTCPWCESKYSHNSEEVESTRSLVTKKTFNVFTCESDDRPWQSEKCKKTRKIDM